MRVFAPRHTVVVALTISGNTTRYNVFTAASSPAGVVQVVLTINSGVVVMSDNTTAAIVSAGFAAGSVLTIINAGVIAGMRGAAGAGGSATAAGSAGGTGGNALSLGLPTTIDNNDGYIYGGGGGGGGGAGGSVFAGGNGGAGAGNGTTAAAAGSASSGDGGRGGNGGDFGMDGANGYSSIYANAASGGAPGKAVALNGYAVTWAAGMNPTQVRGAVS